jgi:tetratricopeptide (TPR) repeat protein
MPVGSSRSFAPVGLIAVAGICVTAAITVMATPEGSQHRHATTAVDRSATTGGTQVTGLATGLEPQIAQTQRRLHDVPGDWDSWATLGLDYVQQARATVDPTYYPKAEGALSRSLQLNATDNIAAFAGEAALSAARHDFRAALRWARRGLAVTPNNAVLLGALCDAETQLGDYAAADAAAQKMESVSPGTDAESRLSYAAELRGDLPAAKRYMQLAQADAGTASDFAFTANYLGDLELSSGRAVAALADYVSGLQRDSSYVALFEGRARAELALGRTNQALADFATAVDRVPQPSYVLEYGELLQSLGRADAAQQQYSLFRTEEHLFRANGVTLDTDQTLFEADHGRVQLAVASGRAALRTRPFLESYDAYAWALHKAGNDPLALKMSNRALATGLVSPLFRYHRGAIEAALHSNSAARADLTAALRINTHFNPLLATSARQLLTRLPR